MNIHVLHHTSEQLDHHGLFSNQDKAEMVNGLRSIIMLSMQCLEVMLRHGHTQDGFDRDSLIQDADPYIENLMKMVRQGTTQQD